MLDGQQEGHLACKKLGVGLLVVTIWLELCKSYSLIAPAVTTTSIILSYNKIQTRDILLPAYPGSPEKWLLQRDRVEQIIENSM